MTCSSDARDRKAARHTRDSLRSQKGCIELLAFDPSVRSRRAFCPYLKKK